MFLGGGFLFWGNLIIGGKRKQGGEQGGERSTTTRSGLILKGKKKGIWEDNDRLQEK